MKKIKSDTFSGFGIGCIIVLAIIMIVKFVLKAEGEAFYKGILEGALRFGASIFGSGAVYLVLFAEFYAACKLTPMVFNYDPEKEHDTHDKLMEHFMELSNPILIICFLTAYILIFLEM